MSEPREISSELPQDFDVNGEMRFGRLVSLPQLEHLSLLVAEDPV
jgi:hypothetical protein